jgi:nitroimidazol reductase NimA-like FMN-containing flavoprotein (pyridoxamine 5'-phosphate oxidase superfamily)
MIGRLSEEMIEQVLTGNLLGRIGCCTGDQMYVVPVSYVYDGKYIFAHSLEGMKIDIMRKNPNVCFQVDEIKDYMNWKSVIAWGKYEELTEGEARYAAMNYFVERTLRMKVSETAALPEVNATRIHPRSPGNIRPVIYRIAVTKKTGRYEENAEKNE